MSNPRNHHYVPQWFIKAWSDEEKVKCFDKKRKIFFSSNPKNICSIKDLHSIPSNHPGEELTIRQIESSIDDVEMEDLETIRELIGRSQEDLDCINLMGEKVKRIQKALFRLSARNPKTISSFSDTFEKNSFLKENLGDGIYPASKRGWSKDVSVQMALMMLNYPEPYSEHYLYHLKIINIGSGGILFSGNNPAGSFNLNNLDTAVGGVAISPYTAILFARKKDVLNAILEKLPLNKIIELVNKFTNMHSDLIFSSPKDSSFEMFCKDDQNFK